MNVLSRSVVVKAGSYWYYTIDVGPEMIKPHVVGDFHASGGSGNDIEAVLAEQNEFENWINGHEAHVYYNSGQTTNGKFDVHLNPGTYILAFSNKFSLVSNKEVTGTINLEYFVQR